MGTDQDPQFIDTVISYVKSILLVAAIGVFAVVGIWFGWNLSKIHLSQGDMPAAVITLGLFAGVILVLIGWIVSRMLFVYQD